MICLKCEQDKDISCFEHQKNRPSPRKVCKSCRYKARDLEKEKIRHREYSKEQRRLNPARIRRNWERTKYGVCKEDLGEQKCLICGSSERLHIDHCHTTGVVRGLLCHYCNIGVGMFKDNPELLIKAVSYIKDGPHFQLPVSKYP